MTTTPPDAHPTKPVPPGPVRPQASFSRTIAMVLSVVVAVVQMQRGHWVEASGLVGLFAGLLLLRLAPNRPVLRWVALACFAVTAAAVVMVFRRDY